jgi:hypothetical protein
MTLPAASETFGRRPAFGIAFLLVAYVVFAPPLFLLSPLLLLLLASRPATGREWLWIGLAALASVRLGFAPAALDSLPNRLILAGAVTMSGTFLILCILFPTSGFPSRVLLAVGLTAAILFGWARTAGIAIEELDQTMLREVTAGMNSLLAGSSPDERDAARAVAGWVARHFSGLLALEACFGISLAWIWYHRVARRPIPPPPGRFRDFTFNDHLVWGAILTLALAVFPLGATLTRAAQDGLVVWGGLYAMRGLAVALAGIASWPLSGKLLILAFALLTFPVATGSLIALGLADTWLAFRDRLRRPEGGGIDAD